MFRKILAALFGKPQKSEVPAPVAAAPAVSEPTLWQALCEQFCPDDASLFVDVQLSITDPAAYLERFEFNLAERGIEKISGVKPWLALVDGLIAREYLAEFDHKVEAVDLAALLEETQVSKAHDVRFAALADSSKMGAELLEEAATEFDRYSLNLLCLDIDSDCYPLIPMPPAKVPEIQRLAQALKQKIHVIPTNR